MDPFDGLSRRVLRPRTPELKQEMHMIAAVVIVLDFRDICCCRAQKADERLPTTSACAPRVQPLVAPLTHAVATLARSLCSTVPLGATSLRRSVCRPILTLYDPASMASCPVGTRTTVSGARAPLAWPPFRTSGRCANHHPWA